MSTANANGSAGQRTASPASIEPSGGALPESTGGLTFHPFDPSLPSGDRAFLQRVLARLAPPAEDVALASDITT